ncbi:FAD/NAD(P)-binding oxidoreductase [Brevibacillus dissolubilis]|uniref:FAD/NAD(P)-binding oxidoreductase n=1 Tax=Brevibacillus dissolubilis TaxID=1844116 RepID=UPI001116FF35|nr:FAD/NAD(P)-binding oxidoreductase [Brevibacillus dissolubilis]
MSAHYKVVIVGAGTAGISVAARLVRASGELRGQVAVIDPATMHYYQPLWTLAGGGAVKKETSGRQMASLIPDGAVWRKEAVSTFHPEENSVITSSGEKLTYEYLVVAAGIQINWDGVKGLKDALGKGGVCSNYDYNTVDYTWQCIQSFKGGTALFTHPNSPVKCGGAPQKIMYLADDYFRKSGVRDQAEVQFFSANASIFQVPRYAATLSEVVKRKNIQPHFRNHLIEVRSATKEAVFEHVDTKEQKIVQYDMLHVTPPMGPPAFLKESPLADATGWVDVDKYTLQHKRYANVFSLGDCSNLPTSKTGAAIRKQAPVVVRNLLAHMQGSPLTATYDGYTSCPLVTGYNRLVMAEFDYNQQPQETFPIDQSKERWSMYVVKKDLLPIMYWNGMLKGLM